MVTHVHVHTSEASVYEQSISFMRVFCMHALIVFMHRFIASLLCMIRLRVHTRFARVCVLYVCMYRYTRAMCVN